MLTQTCDILEKDIPPYIEFSAGSADFFWGGGCFWFQSWAVWEMPRLHTQPHTPRPLDVLKFKVRLTSAACYTIPACLQLRQVFFTRMTHRYQPALQNHDDGEI